MTKKERLQMERLQRLLDAERERAQMLWGGYCEKMIEAVDLKIKIERIEKIIRGQDE